MVCQCKPTWRGGDGCGPDCINRMLCIECTAVSVCPVGAAGWLCMYSKFSRGTYPRAGTGHMSCCMGPHGALLTRLHLCTPSCRASVPVRTSAPTRSSRASSTQSWKWCVRMGATWVDSRDLIGLSNLGWKLVILLAQAHAHSSACVGGGGRCMQSHAAPFTPHSGWGVCVRFVPHGSILCVLKDLGARPRVESMQGALSAAAHASGRGPSTHALRHVGGHAQLCRRTRARMHSVTLGGTRSYASAPRVRMHSITPGCAHSFAALRQVAPVYLLQVPQNVWT